MAAQTKSFKFAQNIHTDEDVREYLQVFLEENGIQGLCRAMNHIAIADIPNSQLASLLKEKGPIEFEQLDDIVSALGLRFTLNEAA